MTRIILASSSIYRKQLLSRITTGFDCISPAVNESPKERETAQDLAARLAIEKAAKVSEQKPNFWIIGSDQTADFEGRLIGKPGSVQNAEAQLRDFSGKEVIFYTAVCLLNKNSRYMQSEVVITSVKFRTLQQDEIAAYLAADLPLDCAGSFRCESLGISLFDSIESADPTALVGLPLITVARFMREVGI
jgi:septum formation protein|tara:strand:- start:20386 stop:20955 length:570 start_codon:yes stop_codon:yes gene_type:complete